MTKNALAQFRSWLDATCDKSCSEHGGIKSALVNLWHPERSDFKTIDIQTLSPMDLFPNAEIPPSMSRFQVIADTLLYAEMLCELPNLIQIDRVGRVIDLGSGSGIPTMRLASKVGGSFEIHSVEIDKAALDTNRMNATALNLENRYRFVRSDIVEFLTLQQFSTADVLASNPPYVPTLDAPAEFDLIDGGPRGTRYLDAILDSNLPAGGYVCIQWSTLTDPLRTCQKIARSYDVLYFRAIAAQFGRYSGAPEIQSYLEKMKLANVSLFQSSTEGKLGGYCVLQTILRRKQT